MRIVSAGSSPGRGGARASRAVAAQLLDAAGVRSGPRGRRPAQAFTPDQAGGAGARRMSPGRRRSILNPSSGGGHQGRRRFPFFYEPLAAFDPDGPRSGPDAAFETIRTAGLRKDGNRSRGSSSGAWSSTTGSRSTPTTWCSPGVRADPATGMCNAGATGLGGSRTRPPHRQGLVPAPTLFWGDAVCGWAKAAIRRRGRVRVVQGRQGREAPGNPGQSGTGPYRYVVCEPERRVLGGAEPDYHITESARSRPLQLKAAGGAASAARAVIQTATPTSPGSRWRTTSSSVWSKAERQGRCTEGREHRTHPPERVRSLDRGPGGAWERQDARIPLRTRSFAGATL